MGPGHIASLQVCVGHRDPMTSVDTVNVITGFGIEGDRHATFDGVRTHRQVLLMDVAVLNSLRLGRGEVRENITTSGIDVHSIDEGTRLGLGDEVVLEITGHCAPCVRMDEIRPGLKDQLDGRRGMLCTVVHGGSVVVGDLIRVLEAEIPPHKTKSGTMD